MDKLMTYISHISLVPNQGTRVDGRLEWPVQDKCSYDYAVISPMRVTKNNYLLKHRIPTTTCYGY